MLYLHIARKQLVFVPALTQLALRPKRSDRETRGSRSWNALRRLRVHPARRHCLLSSFPRHNGGRPHDHLYLKLPPGSSRTIRARWASEIKQRSSSHPYLPPDLTTLQHEGSRYPLRRKRSCGAGAPSLGYRGEQGTRTSLFVYIRGANASSFCSSASRNGSRFDNVDSCRVASLTISQEQGHELIVSSDKEGPGSFFQKNLPEVSEITIARCSVY